MRILFEEVMLNFPHMIDAEFVGELDLVECILKQFQFGSFFPGAWQLMLVEFPSFIAEPVSFLIRVLEKLDRSGPTQAEVRRRGRRSDSEKGSASTRSITHACGARYHGAGSSKLLAPTAAYHLPQS